jgi:hypothetical protein
LRAIYQQKPLRGLLVQMRCSLVQDLRRAPPA